MNPFSSLKTKQKKFSYLGFLFHAWYDDIRCVIPLCRLPFQIWWSSYASLSFSLLVFNFVCLLFSFCSLLLLIMIMMKRNQISTRASCIITILDWVHRHSMWSDHHYRLFFVVNKLKYKTLGFFSLLSLFFCSGFKYLFFRKKSFSFFS